MRCPQPISVVRIASANAVVAIFLITGAAAWGQGSLLVQDLYGSTVGVFAQGDAARMPQLIKDLQNADESVRLRAAKELGKLGAAARDAIPALQGALKDADEDVRRVAGKSLKMIEAAVPPQTQGEIRVNFDALDASKGAVSGDRLAEYLAKFGITLRGVTPGTRIEVLDTRVIYDGKAARASSPPNVISQGGSVKAVAFTMDFRGPADKIVFTRAGLIAATPSGIIHPGWTAIALDASGKEVDRVREPLIASNQDVPPANFTLQGRGIVAVRFESNAEGFAAFGAVLVDDLIVYGQQAADDQIVRLVRDLQNPDESVRLRAAKELGKIGPAAQAAIPMLQKLSQDPDEDVRRVAAAARTRIMVAVQPPGGPRPDLFMLSVGIDSYKPPMNSLKGCVNDAEGMANVFRQQAGKTFGRVDAQVLTDAAGTRANVDAGLAALRTKGKTGDWYTIMLSGHGGPKLNRWGFITHEGNDVTDAVLLGLADQLAGEGKKVIIIIDACFAGQLRYAAHPILNKHTDPRHGGIILMLSSMPAQTSAALMRYSAFARAVEEGLAGAADLDGDRTITLRELRRFTYNRVYELCLDRRPFPGLLVQPQDSSIDASLSIPETTPLAQGENRAAPPRDDGPFTTVPQLMGAWESGPYKLVLNNNGTFRSTIHLDNRIAQMGDGMFKANAKTVILKNWQGDDRLEITALSGDEFRFRFQGREVTLRRQTAPQTTVGIPVFEKSDSLTGGDGKDTKLQGSFAKVYKVNLVEGRSYLINLESSAFDTFLRIENAAGKELAFHDDIDYPADTNSRLVFVAPQTDEYRVIVTSFASGATGPFALSVRMVTSAAVSHGAGETVKSFAKPAPVFVVPAGRLVSKGTWQQQVPQVPEAQVVAAALLKKDAYRIIRPLVDLETATPKLRDDRQRLEAERDRIVKMLNDPGYAAMADAYRRNRNAYAASRSSLDILRVALRRAIEPDRLVTLENVSLWVERWGHLPEWAQRREILQGAETALADADQLYNRGVPLDAPNAPAVRPPTSTLENSTWRSDGRQFNLGGGGVLNVLGFSAPQYGRATWTRTGDNVTLTWDTNLEPIQFRHYVFHGRLSGDTITGTMTMTGWDRNQQIPRSDYQITLTRIGR